MPPLPAQALADDLVETMTAGGAYRITRLPLAEAQEVAAAFAAALIDGRPVTARKTHQAWSGWFKRALWDRTWLGFDDAQDRFWVLRATDID